MRYLIKDLARLTGLSPDRIRKWQERHRLLRPEQGSNGYHYYANDDLFVLKNIVKRLDRGETLAAIASSGRESLLHLPSQDQFSDQEWAVLKEVASGDYRLIEKRLTEHKQGRTFRGWVRHILRPLLVLVGRGWEEGVISVADEHAFSRWFFGQLKAEQEKILRAAAAKLALGPRCLVVTFPGDEHELGALLYNGVLLERGIATRFCGHLPEPELMKELTRNRYRWLSVSMVNETNPEQLEALRARIRDKFPQLRVRFGGAGYRAMRANMKQHTGARQNA